MISHTRTGILCLLAVAALCCPVTTRAQDKATPIPTEQIKALEEALTGNKEESSAARKRLAVKRMVRDAGELLQAHPTAPNRFDVLGVLFRAQQELVAADNSKENREAFLETCKLLAAAPDAYAAQRFDAELLLSQSEMVRKGADTRARAQSLMQLVNRYRATTVGTKAIKVALAMALELGDALLIDDLTQAIAENFAGDLNMIAYQREKLGGQVIGAPFCGAFEKSDGSMMRLPMDGYGKTTVLCFWSSEGDGMKHLEALAASAKEHQADSFGRILIVSFNVDNLPDAGESILRKLGVDWPALRLPGGRENPYYRAFPTRDPAFITLSPTGYAALLMSGSLKNNNSKKDEIAGQPDYTRMFTVNLRREWAGARYTSQLSAIMTAEFLILDPEGPLDPTLPPELKALGTAETHRLTRDASSVPVETLQTIQDCFVMPPVRYRIPNAELKTNYENAESLCAKAIQNHPQAPDLWIVRNRRIIALTGLWKLTGDTACYKRAAAEAKLLLESKPPAGTEVVARLCLVREALRSAEAKPKQIISDYLTTLGGDKAPGPALATAALLALEVGERGLHEAYRRTILDRHAGNPMMWLPVSYLLDRHIRYWLYQVPFSAGWSYGRRENYFLGKGDPEDCQRSLTAELKKLDGSPFQIPKDTTGKWTIVYFTTPEQQDPALFAKSLAGQMKAINLFIENRVPKDVQVFTAILGKDAEWLSAIDKGLATDGPILTVPDGLRNPLVQKLGIVSEDERPNVLVLQPDGSIAACLSGGGKHAAHVVQNIIAWHDEKLVNAALDKGDLEEAKRLAFQFAPTEIPISTDPKKKNRKPEPQHTSHLRTRAKVYLALKDYVKALADAQEVVARQISTDGGMSLRTPELDEAEQFRDSILELQNPTKKPHKTD